MKVINTGIVYDIMDDSLCTFDTLPPQSYSVCFSDKRGFYLMKHADIEIKEDKIYGVHLQKVNKVLNTFSKVDRNLGIILSGDKGIGKSLFARILSQEAINRNIPLIIVDQYIPGIASYLESIEQEVIVLFDEFDKTFGDVKAGDGQASPQTTLLSLFDGTASGKKLFVITCNEIRKLNDFLINRPGRFHYHFRFNYPNADEIRAYLEDKISPQYYKEIDEVISFSRKIDLNYDCLRAISFELETGISFKEAIKDLNILNMETYVRYNIVLTLENGLTFVHRNYGMNLFATEEDTIWLGDSRNGHEYLAVEFNPSDLLYNMEKGVYYAPLELLKIKYSDYSSDKEEVEKIKSLKVQSLHLSRVPEKNIHYMI